MGAQKGTLTIMVGAEAEHFQSLKQCFEAMGKNIVLCGDVGSGQAVKLCNQVGEQLRQSVDMKNLADMWLTIKSITGHRHSQSQSCPLLDSCLRSRRSLKR